ncbi:MAG: hypothetical protein EA376_03420 [Phycisphaeraceae bacterium]|nr:MAG: hypothetical protein EA376_03420 [Phycisphaeraceae bacterium]
MKIRSAFVRGVVSGFAGGVAWLIGVALFFGPAQGILGDPERQSEKLIEAFTAAPAPRTVEAPWILPVALLAIGGAWGCMYVWIRSAWPGPWWKRGLRFALLGWVIMALWFEFYLLWNVLHEPTMLVALELACWAGVMSVVGLAIAGMEAALRPAH